MLERWQATSASVRGAGIFETAFLVQERRKYLLLLRRRESVPCDLRRWTKLHYASFGYSGCASRARREVPNRGTLGREGIARCRILRSAAAESRSRECSGHG